GTCAVALTLPGGTTASPDPRPISWPSPVGLLPPTASAPASTPPPSAPPTTPPAQSGLFVVTKSVTPRPSPGSFRVGEVVYFSVTIQNTRTTSAGVDELDDV